MAAETVTMVTTTCLNNDLRTITQAPYFQQLLTVKSQPVIAVLLKRYIAITPLGTQFP
jgi:hypothetical protein